MEIRSALKQATSRLDDAEVASPGPDAALLLAHAAGVSLAELRRQEVLGGTFSPDVAARFNELVHARAQRVPLQHLTGRAPFRHLDLAVGPGVFVPRPETEMLVDAVIENAPKGGVVVDLCTGSGAIALAVASERPDLQVYAVEVDPLAAAWTARNIKETNLNVNLSVEDARHALPELEGQCDVVVSNPPYVPIGMVPLVPEVADHDPEIALYGGSDDGLLFPVQIAERASRLLAPGGLLFMEHAEAQGESLPAALLDRRGFDRAHDEPDATGRPRMTVARKEGGARFAETVAAADRPTRTRASVRVLVVDDDNHVLLYEDSDQGMNPPFTWWSTPGGGIDPGETPVAAAVRELWEETGLVISEDALSDVVATRTVVHGFSDKIDTQHDTFVAVHVPRFTPHPGHLTPEEEATMQRWHWWTAEEITRSSDRFWPAQTAALLECVVRGETLNLPNVEESSLPVDAQEGDGPNDCSTGEAC